VEKIFPKLCTTSVINKTVQRKQSPNRLKFAQSGHPESTLAQKRVDYFSNEFVLWLTTPMRIVAAKAAT
jgi:hypothetical protein